MTTIAGRPTALPELTAVLRRHVGHSLRCVRETVDGATASVDTVSLRCDDCGEVVLETVTLEQRRKHGRS